MVREETAALRAIASNLLVTREDAAAAARRREVAAHTDAALAAAFDAAREARRPALHHAAAASQRPAVVDAREFTAYLSALGVVPDQMSKADALRHYAAARAAAREPGRDRKELDLPEFRAAVRAVARALGRTVLQLLGAPAPPASRPPAAAGDRLTEAVEARRDALIVAERRALSTILATAGPSQLASRGMRVARGSAAEIPDDDAEDDWGAAAAAASAAASSSVLDDQPGDSELALLAEIRTELASITEEEGAGRCAPGAEPDGAPAAAAAATTTTAAADPLAEAVRSIDRALASALIAVGTPASGASRPSPAAAAPGGGGGGGGGGVRPKLAEAESDALRRIEMALAAGGPGAESAVLDAVNDYCRAAGAPPDRSEAGRLLLRARREAGEPAAAAAAGGRAALEAGRPARAVGAALLGVLAGGGCVAEDDGDSGGDGPGLAPVLDGAVAALRAGAGGPGREAAWASKGATVVRLGGPPAGRVLVGQDIEVGAGPPLRSESPIGKRTAPPAARPCVQLPRRGGGGACMP